MGLVEKGVPAPVAKAADSSEETELENNTVYLASKEIV
jgi:hypothetical protein